jgi:hypothetical protein
MKRLVFAIQSAEGYLVEVEKYATDITEAPTFVDFDNASRKLGAVRKWLTKECWIGVDYVPFPGKRVQ